MGLIEKKYDLCYDCTIALREFMNDNTVTKVGLNVSKEVVYKAYDALLQRKDIDEAIGVLGEALDA